MKNNHTPTPWVINATTYNGAIVRWHIAGPTHGSCYPICEHILEQKPDATQQLEDAAHIVRCVNSHDELLAACKLAATSDSNCAQATDDQLREAVLLGNDEVKRGATALLALRTAIANAEAKHTA